MLSKRDIEKELGKGINIVPVIRDNFKENSINLTVSENAWTQSSATVYWYGGESFGLKDTPAKKKTRSFRRGSKCEFHVSRKRGKVDKYIILLPHTTTLIETSEVIGVANYIGGALHSKVGLVAKGIGHIGTMLGPGFCGHLLVSLHNITEEVIALKVGTTFVSLSFDYLTTQVARTSSTTSGHVDKFSELGIEIDEQTRNYLTADWKSNIEGIREHMCESEAYKSYKKHMRQNSWKEIKKYVNKRNIITLVILVVVFCVLYFVAAYADHKAGTNIWVDRFWNVGCSGFVGSMLVGTYNFIKDKK